MRNLKIGELYDLKLKHNKYSSRRVLIISYKPFHSDDGIYFYDFDRKELDGSYLENIVESKKLDLSIIKDIKLRQTLLDMQLYYSKISEREEKYSKYLSELDKEYKRIKEKHDKAHEKYFKEVQASFYKLEDKANKLALSLINSDFDLNSQNIQRTSLTMEQFREEIWKNLNPILRAKLLSPCHYTLEFRANTFVEDGGCWYYLDISREVVVNYPYKLEYDNPNYQKFLDRESGKELPELRYLSCVPFTPYEDIERISSYYNNLYFGYGLLNKDKNSKKQNIYSSNLLHREFKPFPLTIENAKRIAESIYIDY